MTGYVALMVRRDSKSQLLMPFMSKDEDCCAEPTGESPVPVSVGAPDSRPPESREISAAEAGCQKPREWEQPRGPQHQANAAASSDKQWASRAAHVTAKATSTAPDPKREVDSSGVWAVARVEGSVRNTGDEEIQPARQLRLEPAPPFSGEAEGPPPEGRRGPTVDEKVLLATRASPTQGHRPISGDYVMQRPETSPVSRVRENRTHGSKGGLLPALRANARMGW